MVPLTGRLTAVIISTPQLFLIVIRTKGMTTWFQAKESMQGGEQARRRNLV